MYKPPFRYDEYGYIFDADGKMFADEGGANEMLARIRGWGRLQYVKDSGFTPEQIQDECGRLFADALTEFWLSNTQERHDDT